MNPSEEMNLRDDGFPEELVDGLLRQSRARIGRALALVRRPEAAVGLLRTAIGPLLIVDGARGLVTIKFFWLHDSAETIASLRTKFDLVDDPKNTAQVGAEIRGYLRGDPDALTHRIDLSLVESPFRRNALEHLREVPRGAVTTYQTLAAAAGNPDAQRAVGTTMATNPIPLYVPCHRVIRSDGTVGEYGGGPKLKARLLELEGFKFDRSHHLSPSVVWGHRRTHIFCRPDCPAARRADPARQVIFADSKHAERAGWRPCKVCQPA